MKIIGLTGGIGSGKTTVSDYLRTKGFSVIDADKVSREIVAPGMRANLAIKSAFGSDFINLDGTLNRKKLGSLVFSQPEKLDCLNKIMHQEINGVIKKRILELEEKKGKVIFVDAPLLFETGLDQLTQETWVIDMPENLRLNRIMERDQISRQDAAAIMANQMDQKTKNEKATIVIDNSTGMEELLKKIDQLVEKYEA